MVTPDARDVGPPTHVTTGVVGPVTPCVCTAGDTGVPVPRPRPTTDTTPGRRGASGASRGTPTSADVRRMQGPCVFHSWSDTLLPKDRSSASTLGSVAGVRDSRPDRREPGSKGPGHERRGVSVSRSPSLSFGTRVGETGSTVPKSRTPSDRTVWSPGGPPRKVSGQRRPVGRSSRVPVSGPGGVSREWPLRPEPGGTRRRRAARRGGGPTRATGRTTASPGATRGCGATGGTVSLSAGADPDLPPHVFRRSPWPPGKGARPPPSRGLGVCVGTRVPRESQGPFQALRMGALWSPATGRPPATPETPTVDRGGGVSSGGPSRGPKPGIRSPIASAAGPTPSTILVTSGPRDWTGAGAWCGAPTGGSSVWSGGLRPSGARPRLGSTAHTAPSVGVHTVPHDPGRSPARSLGVTWTCRVCGGSSGHGHGLPYYPCGTAIVSRRSADWTRCKTPVWCRSPPSVDLGLGVAKSPRTVGDQGSTTSRTPMSFAPRLLYGLVGFCLLTPPSVGSWERESTPT